MSHKKRYIFITNGISELGGIELYLLNKCQWLEKNGWEIHVFSAHYCLKRYKIKALRKYKKENLPFLAFPPYAYSKKHIIAIITKFKSFFKNAVNETVVESHSGSTALWGELFAKELGARHHIELLHEYFEEDCYSINKAFFVFKLNRSEIFCGLNAKKDLIEKILHEDYNKAVKNIIYYNPVVDVNCERLKKIKKADYTICYIGRTNKPYFPSIVTGVSEFALKHNNSSVQFVVVGKRQKKVIRKYLGNCKNILLVELGELFPIPRKLYSYVDCICAGAGSARCSVNEGKPVIVPDPTSFLANGVLGYETNESVSSDDNCIPQRFADAFENVLVLKNYLKKDFSYPTSLSLDECCKRNVGLIFRRDYDSQYYELENMLIYKPTRKYMLNALLDLKTPAIRLIKNHLFKLIRQIIPFVFSKTQKDKGDS